MIFEKTIARNGHRVAQQRYSGFDISGNVDIARHRSDGAEFGGRFITQNRAALLGQLAANPKKVLGGLVGDEVVVVRRQAFGKSLAAIYGVCCL